MFHGTALAILVGPFTQNSRCAAMIQINAVLAAVTLLDSYLLIAIKAGMPPFGNTAATSTASSGVKR
jgi:hypothetical protein